MTEVWTAIAALSLAVVALGFASLIIWMEVLYPGRTSAVLNHIGAKLRGRCSRCDAKGGRHKMGCSSAAAPNYVPSHWE